MAGINRLGKAPPRPGSLRPADPNRNRTIDFFSEDQTGVLESDRDYQRTVQDIEDAQQTQGWLFGRGAFDKTDLLYLRDQEEKSRHMEQELHDREVTQYARLRLHAEKQRPQDGILGATKVIDKDKERPKPMAKKIAGLVKRKGGGAAAAVLASASVPSPTASASKPEISSPGAAASLAREADSEPAGLPGLLGDYGSDSDDRGSDASGAEDSKTAAREWGPAATQSQERTASAAAKARAHDGAKAVREQDLQQEEEEVDYGT